MRSNGLPSTSEMMSVTSRPARQPAAGRPLDAAKRLADRVQLLDIGPGRVQMPRDGQFVGQGDALHGAGISAEPPPEIRQRQRSSGPSDSTSRKIFSVPATPSGMGSFTPAGRAACRWIRDEGGRNRPAR